MQKHIITERLLEVADKEIRFTESEFNHFKKCNACLLAYAQCILQVARTRARAKCRTIPVVEARISECAECQQEMEMLRQIIRSFVSWPIDVLRPSESLWGRLAQRISAETGTPPLLTPSRRPEQPAKPEWEEVAPGISVQMLATDREKNRASMLVRLEPGTDYPPHCHAGAEELHLLHGELMVDDRKFYPGDFIHAEAGSVDHRVWSEAGCTCFLMTSTKDIIL